MKPFSVKAVCELVTPMLTAGADQQHNELRGQAVKYGLRFWWRAFQPKRGEALYAEEARLFGGRSGGQSLASPFRVSISQTNESGHETILRTWKPGNPVQMAGQPNSKGPGPGIQYLLFPVVSPGDPAAKKSSEKGGRPVAIPGKESQFTIKLTFDRIASMDQAGDVICALWLLVHLSGLGGRTRRGAGCFDITDINLEDLKDHDHLPAFSPNKGQTPEKFIQKGLDIIKSRWQTDKAPADDPGFTAFMPGKTHILVCHHGSSANRNAFALLEELGGRMKNYCSRYPHDEARAMANRLATGAAFPGGLKLRKSERGLPIVYYFGQDLPGYTLTTVKCDASGKPIKGSDGDFEKGSERRASPLFMSCHNNKKGGTPFALLSYFPGQLIAGNEKLWLKCNNRAQKGKDEFFVPPSTGFIEQLIYQNREYANSDGTTKALPALIGGFGTSIGLFPQFKDLSPVVVQPVHQPAAQGPPHLGPLLRQIQNMTNPNPKDFHFQRIIETMGEYYGDGKENDAKALAGALKKRLEELGQWEGHVSKDEIEFYLK